MKFLFKTLLFLTVLTVFLAPLLVVWKAVDRQPYVEASGPILQQDYMRAKKIIRANRPDRVRERQGHTLELSKEDLNLLVRYALNQALGNDRIGSRVDLKKDLMIFHVSYPIPPNPLGRYINFSLGIALKNDRPQIYAAQMGSLILPGFLAQPAAAFAHKYLLNLNAYETAYAMMDGIRQIRFLPDHVYLSYSLDPKAIENLKEKARQQLFSQAHQNRIKTYHNLLADTPVCSGGRVISLVDILTPLFAAAVENTGESKDPAGENKAVLQVLAAFVSQTDMAAFMSEHIRLEMKPIPSCIPTLFGREDLAQHLLVSAAVTVSASRRLADIIGLAKEIEDSEDGGSGFSFADLAADKAGVKLGELASASQAGKLQQRLKNLNKESELMPDISKLPDPMSAEQFRQRYQDTGSPAYKEVESYIEAGLAKCPVLQE